MTAQKYSYSINYNQQKSKKERNVTEYKRGKKSRMHKIKEYIVSQEREQ